jgi:hypothetical protein
VLKGKAKVARLRKEVKKGLYRLDDVGLHSENLLPTLLYPDVDLGGRDQVHCLCSSPSMLSPLVAARRQLLLDCFCDQSQRR